VSREGRDDPILLLARLDEIALDYLKKTVSAVTEPLVIAIGAHRGCGGEG